MSRQSAGLRCPYRKVKQRTGNTVVLYRRKCDRNSGCHGFGVFDKAVSSWFDNVSEEHGLTEDGKTVAPFSQTSVTMCWGRVFRFQKLDTRALFAPDQRAIRNPILNPSSDAH